MKKSFAYLFTLAALALAGLAAGFSSAQGPPIKPGPGGSLRPILTDPTKAKKVDKVTKSPIDLDKAKKITTGLRIARFDAARDSRDIGLTGAIENVSFQPITGVSFSMFKRTASGWQLIKSGSNMTINPRKTIYIFGSDVASNAMMQYKLEVASPGQADVREFSLAERKLSFVVRYDTKGAKLTARRYPPSEETRVNGPRGLSLHGELPRRLQSQLQGLGFESSMRTKRYEHAFSDWEFEFWVYASTTAPVQRTFDNRQSAVVFRDQLLTLVRDKGLTVEILER